MSAGEVGPRRRRWLRKLKAAIDRRGRGALGDSSVDTEAADIAGGAMLLGGWVGLVSFLGGMVDYLLRHPADRTDHPRAEPPPESPAKK